jgi:hypothetical protein
MMHDSFICPGELIIGPKGFGVLEEGPRPGHTGVFLVLSSPFFLAGDRVAKVLDDQGQTMNVAMWNLRTFFYRHP